MSAPDPIPADIAERIRAANKAEDAAGTGRGLAYPTYLRQLVAARRELAAAFRAAYEHTTPDTVLFFAVLNAYTSLEARAEADEREADEFERKNAAGGQA